MQVVRERSSLVSSYWKVLASYTIDCVVLIVFAAVAAGLNFVSPTRRLFSVTDPTIAYPNLPDTVSITVVFLAAVVAPAAIVCIVTLLFITRRGNDGTRASPSLIWRRKLWELFTGLLGLAFAVIFGFFLTQAAKNLFGKPRPDFLARCRPDLANYASYVDGGFTSEILEGTSVHVRWEICQARNGTSSDMSILDDGFRSFPSGHCTVAFAGLVYLSLYLAAKFSVTIPFLSPTEFKNIKSTLPPVSNGACRSQIPNEQRSETAAPPIYLFVLVFIPTAAAIYIASSRFKDYKHHGFDVFFSSVEGTICAWLAFRWYHMPIRRGAGWAWGPRSGDRAFGIRIGVGTYHESEKIADGTGQVAGASARGWHGSSGEDIELGSVDRRGTFDSASSRARIVQS